MKSAKLAEDCGGDCEQNSSSQHLGSGAHDFGRGQRQLAGQGGSNGPTHGGDHEGGGSGEIDGGFANTDGAADQDRDSGDSYEKRKGKPYRKPLGAQKDDLR